MNQKLVISLIVGLLIGLGLSYKLYRVAPAAIAPDISQKTTATSSPDGKKKLITVGGITFETDADNPGGITLEQVPITEVPKPIPTLSAAVDFSPSVAADAREIIKAQIASLVKKLTDSPGNLNDWLALGLYRKMAGDYPQAKIVWEYAKKLQPSDKQAYNNLGDLYQYYLKDFKQAEANWKKTVALEPQFVAGWRNLYDLYVQNNQLDKAKIILETGLAKNPRNIDLLVLLANYYKNQGNKVQAKSYFSQALTETKLSKENANMIPVLQAEIDAL